MVEKFLSFLKGAYSDNGTPSSSRLLTSFLAVVVSYILISVFNHIIHLADANQLSIWLANIPYVVGALAFFFMAPYGINQGSGSIVDLLNLFKGKKNE